SYSVNNAQPIQIAGKAIIPLPLYNDTTRVDTTDKTAVDAALQNSMRIAVTEGVAEANIPPVVFNYDVSSLSETAKYLVVNYSYTFAAGTMSLDTPIRFTYRAPNLDQGI